MKPKIVALTAGLGLASILLLASCTSPADVASYNLSKSADNFEINRRIVFYNGITDSYMLTIEGLCSLGNNDKPGTVSITCKTGEVAGISTFKKHFLGLSDNVTFFVEQLEPMAVGTFHYRVMFRPQSIVPDVDFQADGQELRQ
jgi:hypothetical protein